MRQGRISVFLFGRITCFRCGHKIYGECKRIVPAYDAIGPLGVEFYHPDCLEILLKAYDSVGVPFIMGRI